MIINSMLFFCVFFIFFKNNFIVCDERFLKSIFINGHEFFVSEHVTLSQAINSKINFINFWKPKTNFNLIRFNSINNTRFVNSHPLSHWHLLLFKDVLNEVFWTFQFTSNPPANAQHIFTLLSEFNLNGQKTPQFIWNKPGLIGFEDALIKKQVLSPLHLEQNINCHVVKAVIRQDINPHFFSFLLNK